MKVYTRIQDHKGNDQELELDEVAIFANCEEIQELIEFLTYVKEDHLVQHKHSRTGVEPNCPTTMHFRIFRRAFTRKMVITEEGQIIRPATSNFCVLCRNSPCKMRILLRLASTKSIKNCNAGGCFAVLSEQILCRCKEKMRSNISYCENFICSKCGYLSLKTVWIWLSSVMLLRKITPKSIKNAFAGGCEQF